MTRTARSWACSARSTSAEPSLLPSSTKMTSQGARTVARGHLRGAVAAAVVHEDDLVRLSELLESLGESMVEVAEARGLVEDGHDDRDHRETSRTRRQSL